MGLQPSGTLFTETQGKTWARLFLESRTFYVLMGEKMNLDHYKEDKDNKREAFVSMF